MKYKFKPQTCLLVAGLLAATYAEACYYQNTSVLCVANGVTVDTHNWLDNTGTGITLTATTDWVVSYTSPHLVWQSTGAGGATSYTGGGNQYYCHGPAKFLDYSSHSVSVPDWMADSISSVNTTMPVIFLGASTSGSPC